MNAEIISPRRKHELLGVIWGFLALFWTLCLVSYSPKDPCPFIREGQTAQLENWMGPVGASLSGWMMTVFGFSSWMLPPALLMFAVWSFRGKGGLPLHNKPKLMLRLGGCILLILSASMFFELAFGKINFDGELLRSGGILGGALSGWVSGILGPAGSMFLGALLTILALMAAVDFSPVSAYRLTTDFFSKFRQRAGSSLVQWREAEKRHKEVAEVREEIEKTRTQPKPQIKIVIDEKPKADKKT